MSRWRGWLGVLLLLGSAGCQPSPGDRPPAREIAVHLAQREAGPGLQQMQDRDGRSWWVEQPARLCCGDFRSVELALDENNAPLVIARLSDEASPRLATLTRENIGQVMAVLVEGELLVAATLMSEISGGQLALRGFGSVEEAQRLIGR
jgi:preprotein translocase subunit SecD